MANINKKSLIIAIIIGFASWLWAFIIVGSAVVDMATGQPVETFNFGYYIAMIIVSAVLNIVVIALYLWKYGQNNPIIADNWVVDAILFGAIICAMNFLFDALFFGVIAGQDLISYFWLETTTGYFYPLIIVETLIIAYIIYGRKE